MIRKVKDMSNLLNYSVWYNSVTDNTMCLVAKTIDYATAIAIACMRWSYNHGCDNVIVYNEVSDTVIWECTGPVNITHASGVYNLPVEIVANGGVKHE